VVNPRDEPRSASAVPVTAQDPEAAAAARLAEGVRTDYTAEHHLTGNPTGKPPTELIGRTKMKKLNIDGDKLAMELVKTATFWMSKCQESNMDSRQTATGVAYYTAQVVLHHLRDQRVIDANEEELDAAIMSLRDGLHKHGEIPGTSRTRA
jgi:hypothetical protein